MLSNWLKKTCATFFILSEIKPKPTETRLASPTCNYFEYLIGSPVITLSFWLVHCVLLWLAGVIPYVLLLQHSFENCSNSPYEKISIACHCQISFPPFFSVEQYTLESDGSEEEEVVILTADKSSGFQRYDIFSWCNKS